MENMLLILRVEIVCILILLFLLTYYTIFKVKDKEYFFLKLSCIALSHVFFQAFLLIATTYRVFLEPRIIRLLYVGFYATGIAFVVWFFSYVVRRLAHYKRSVPIRVIGYILLAIYVIVLSTLPIDEHATYYGDTTLDLIGYGVFLLYCTICTLILLQNRKKYESGAKMVLLPVVLIMYLTVILQALFPKMRLTGGCLTIICVALFAALDNPDKDFTKQALWDFSTGLKNRNSYNQDLAKYTDHSFRKKPRRIGLLVADMNYLKVTNDQFGHMEGDKLLKGAAATLREHLRSAEDIYRLGGDEFVAIYLSVDDEVVTSEMENVLCACQHSTEYATPLSFAMGYASGSTDGDIDAIFNEADLKMYEHKAQIKGIEAVP